MPEYRKIVGKGIPQGQSPSGPYLDMPHAVFADSIYPVLRQTLR